MLMTAMNLNMFKEDIYAPYGVSSSKDMSNAQLVALIARLEDHMSESDRRTVSENDRKKAISACLTIITDKGWMGYPNGDWESINALVSSKRFGNGKTLRDMSIEELKAVRKKLVAAHTKGLRYRNRNDYLHKESDGESHNTNRTKSKICYITRLTTNILS